MAAKRAEGQGEAESWTELHEELDRLPEKYRTPLVLYYLNELTYEQAANELGCPVRTVRTRLIRGGRLRRTLTRRGLAPMAGLLGVSLASGSARAAVKAALVEVTARSAMRFAAGQAGVLSLSALSLAKGVLKALLFAKLKFVAVHGLAWQPKPCRHLLKKAAMGSVARPASPRSTR